MVMDRVPSLEEEPQQLKLSVWLGLEEQKYKKLRDDWGSRPEETDQALRMVTPGALEEALQRVQEDGDLFDVRHWALFPEFCSLLMFSLITRISVRKKAPRDPYESEFGLPTSGHPILSLLMTRRRKPWRLFEPSKVLRYTDNLAVNFVLMSFYLVKSSMAACLECKLLMKVGGLDVETFLNCSYIAHAAQELVQERTLARK
jgi:hypothetical protein